MKYPIPMALLMTTGLLVGCASNSADVNESADHDVVPGRYVSDDDSQTWVFWENGMYEHATVVGGDERHIDWGQWWAVTGQGTVVAHGGAEAPTILQAGTDDVLSISPVGNGHAVELEREDDPAPLETDRSMALCFMTMADAPLAYDPLTMRNWPVEMAVAYPQLESAYRSSGLRPPARLPVVIDGRWTEAQDGAGKQLYVHPSALKRVMQNESAKCPGTTLQNNYWVLSQLNGHSIEREEGQREIYMQFDENRQVSGLAGCNRFSGPFERRRDDLTLGPLATTRMMCPGRAETEAAFMDVLNRTGRFAIEGAKLFLMAPEGQILAVLRASGPSPLDGDR